LRTVELNCSPCVIGERQLEKLIFSVSTLVTRADKSDKFGYVEMDCCDNQSPIGRSR